MPYFDHNATSPLTPTALETWRKSVAEEWANPSSLYRAAARARTRLEVLRERLSDYLGADDKRVLFNSGATEGANAVLRYWARRAGSQPRVLVAATEHSCVRASAEAAFPGRTGPVPLLTGGRVDLDALAKQLAVERIAGVCVMAANNETGLLQPWREIAALCRSHGVPYLCDATQWLGKLPASGLGGCDWVIASAHKWGGPRGVGLLVRAPDAEDFVALAGGGQEFGHRSGTENLAGIHAAVDALVELEQTQVFQEMDRTLWRDRFVRLVRERILGVKVVCENDERLWNTVLVVMPHTEQQRWVLKLDKRGFQVATGSACSAGKPGQSHVLAALGYDAVDARRALRFSSSWTTPWAEWEALAEALAAVAAELGGETTNVVQP
ncbi:cysteine desulfurase family protein [Nibricoccus sp. IMCC34717]|uniref:cysteine desulfurase family protein n=1 Tax=Nibricoccus sp. IMCC34717 TaxID=3034021 RepID=UPI00384A8A39